MLYPVYEDIKSQSGENVSLESSLESFLGSLDTENSNQTLEEFNRQIEDEINRSNSDSSNLPKIRANISLISSPPIIQMKFKNWISDNNGDGLYGKLDGFKYKPKVDEGVFISEDGRLIAMSYECSVEFTVIHTDKLGFGQDKQLRTKGFPYTPFKK